ncbi:MAG: winged helix-turn-helix domain-containing protein [Chloroflexota bacterium]|nr:winged helix-turn-helix domain-containing protein [Chloroflexota bacterium]
MLAAVALALALAGAHRPAVTRAQTPGPDSAMIDRVVSSLTVDERVGQLVMVNFVGSDVSATSDIASLIRDFKVGSVLVTASNGNIVNRGDTPAQIAALTNGLQQRAYEATRRGDAANPYFIPLLIATDNEGDLYPLTNVTNGYTAIPDNMTIGATWSKKHAEATGQIVGKELSAAGINMLLGPAVDVLDTPRSGGGGDIGVRSFGGNATWVGELGRAFVRGVHEGSAGRMLTVAKHFPGHGESDRSTDDQVPTVNKSLDQLRQTELAPFAEVDRVAAGASLGTTDGMMVSHIRYRNFVPSSPAPFTRPISLDRAALTTLLQLPEFSSWRANHFMMSDSLGVPAIKKWYAQEQGQPDFPNRTVVRDALMAGSDLLPFVEFYHDPAHPGWRDNQLPVIQDSILYMRQQYAADPDFRRRVDDAVRHIIAAKLKLYPKLQLSQVLADPTAATAAAGQGDAEMRSLAEDALTLVQPASVSELRARLPRGPISPEKVLIVECWADCYPYRIKSKLDLQNTLLALYGPAGQGRLKPEDVSTISFGELDAWLSKPADPANAATAKAVGDASWLIFALAEYNPDARPASGAVKRFLDAPPVDLRNKTMVAIAYNVPYDLGSTELSSLTAFFAVYNKTQAAIEAGFRALYGDITPKGHSPVNIAGIFYNVNDAVRPDPSQDIRVSVYGQNPNAVANLRTLPLVAGPIVDMNGDPVPDGSAVSFTLTDASGVSTGGSAKTVDGMAVAEVAAGGPGKYTVTASIADITSKALALTVGAAAPPTSVAPSTVAVTAGRSSRGTGMLLAIGIPIALAAIAAAVVGGVVYRRRHGPAAAGASASGGEAPDALAPVTPPPPATPPALHVDMETRRVYVHGSEARPGLSNEQFRLLAYLYERRGKVIGREELVTHVWPDAHVEGVSEEALDALVRRVRERIVQAGGERRYIVTLRGQGFRLDV